MKQINQNAGKIILEGFYLFFGHLKVILYILCREKE